MSVKVMTWVWEHSESEGTARLVALAIADHADDAGRNAFPGQQRLANKCRISVRTVRRAIDEVVALGELAVDAYEGQLSKTGEGRRTHRYSFPKFAAMLSSNHELPDSLTPNRGEVGGHPGQVGGHPGSSCGTPVAGEPPLTVSDPSGESALTRLDEVELVDDSVDPLLESVLARSKAPRAEWEAVLAFARHLGIRDEALEQTAARCLWPSDLHRELKKLAPMAGIAAAASRSDMFNSLSSYNDWIAEESWKPVLEPSCWGCNDTGIIGWDVEAKRNIGCACRKSA
jgi:hypothetical protein